MNTIITIALIACITVQLVNCGVLSDRDPRGGYKQYVENESDQKTKRPFCNSFTGCGRKRSNEVENRVPVQSSMMDLENKISDLLELNSGPVIENLMRQIMSEAKMYEAIQEANREALLEKIKQLGKSNRQPPSAYALQ